MRKTTAALAILVAGTMLPGRAQASVVINSISQSPGGLSGKITYAGHFSDLAVSVGRFQLTGKIQPGNTPVSYMTYCVDLLHYISNGTFEIKPLSVLVSNPVKRTQLTTLLTNVDPLIVGVTQSAKNMSAAAQLAVWEIISETSNSGYSLTAGLFSAKGTNAATLSLAQTYLTNVTNGAWSPVAGKELRILYSPTNQSQVFITAVPEPATWLSMLIGFAMIGRAIRFGRARQPALRAL